MKKTITYSMLALAASLAFVACGKRPIVPETHGTPDEKVVIAYVYKPNSMPDPTYLTHINYAFGHVTDSFDGVWVEAPEKLKGVCKLKKKYPHLKVLVSIGGWGSGNFSEMAADSLKRLAFAADCMRLAQEFKLDGIDIDWEYPTSKAAGISYSPEDDVNYIKLMRDLRAALGNELLLTHAVCAGRAFFDFAEVDQYMDFHNLMTYDFGNPPQQHNSPLHRSKLTPRQPSIDDTIAMMDSYGIDHSKIVLGMPFYGRGANGFQRVKDMPRAYLMEGYTYHWDAEACVPYLTDDKTGKMVFSYENEKSLYLKSQYVLEKGLKGAMYWDYRGDTPEGTYRRLVYKTLNQGLTLNSTIK